MLLRIAGYEALGSLDLKFCIFDAYFSTYGPKRLRIEDLVRPVCISCRWSDQRQERKPSVPRRRSNSAALSVLLQAIASKKLVNAQNTYSTYYPNLISDRTA